MSMTAVVLLAPDGRGGERLVESVVGFARLTAAQIDAYVASGEWQGKAGGYAIQGRAASHIRFLSGSYSDVVGLPLFETAQLLRGFGALAAVTTRLLVAASPGEVRVAADAGRAVRRLCDLAPGRAGRRGRPASRPGHRAGARDGRGVRRPRRRRGVPAGQRGRRRPREGDAVGVRVTRAAQGGKGPRLTARLSAAEAALVGTGPPALLRRGPNRGRAAGGPVSRGAGAGR